MVGFKTKNTSMEFESIAPSLLHGQITFLYKNKMLTMWGNLLLAGILLFFLWIHLFSQQIPLLVWFGLIAGLSIFRFITERSFTEEIHYSQSDLGYWANRHVFFTTLISTLWGLSSVVFFPHDLAYQALMTLILFSVLLIAIPTLAASRIAYYLQIFVSLMPIILLLFLERKEAQGLLAIAIIMTAITLMFISNYIYQLVFELQNTQIALRDLADMDQLTQLANRRHFDEKFKHEWRRAMREKTPISLLLIDVDYFKKFNDTYGHQAGDTCLQKIAEALQSIIHRPADLASRYGGEEFSILLPITKLEDAAMLAERLRAKIEMLKIEHSQSEFGMVTISIGVSCCEPAWDFTGKELDEDQKVIFPAMLLTAADNALYVSKEQGRNQVSEQGCGDQKIAQILQNRPK